MQQIILVIHIITCIALIALILIQQGKGAEVGASFGSGASQTVFGSQGSGNFLTHLTAGLATLFFITTLGLGYFATRQSEPSIDELLNKVDQTSTQSGTQSNTNTQTHPENVEQGDIPKVPE